jgi:hypothetical protein
MSEIEDFHLKKLLNKSLSSLSILYHHLRKINRAAVTNALSSIKWRRDIESYDANDDGIYQIATQPNYTH